MQVKQLALSKLKADPKNARRHPERNLNAIVGSLKDHGQVEPIIVQKGTNRIIAGHGRAEALRQLGEKQAFVVELEVTDKEATLLGVRLNKTGELAEWDFQNLSELFRELATEDLAKTGFADFEIEPLLNAEWAPPAVSEAEFSRSHEEEALGDNVTVTLDAEQGLVFRRAKAAQDPQGKESNAEALVQICKAFLGD